MITPNRRWFSFSLRTLFVLVTVLCVAFGWLVYHLNWVRERHAAIKEVAFPEYAIPGHPPFHFPIGLRLLGDEALNFIDLDLHNKLDRLSLDDAFEEGERFKRLFPESHVYRRTVYSEFYEEILGGKREVQ